MRLQLSVKQNIETLLTPKQPLYSKSQSEQGHFDQANKNLGGGMKQDAHNDAKQEHSFLRHFRFTAIKRGPAAPKIGDGG